MKVLHAAALLRPPSGIMHQMQWEQDAACELAIEWKVRMFCPADGVGPSEIVVPYQRVRADAGSSRVRKLIDWVALRWGYARWLKGQESEVDVFLLRYYVHDPFQLYFVKFCKKPVYFVHHTLEGFELAMPGGWRDRVRSVLDAILAGAAIRAASGVVGVTEEIIRYERERSSQPAKKAFLYPNGISGSKLSPVLDERSDIPEILFVASYFSPWHGLDLLLESMASDNTPCVVHLVGSMSDDELAMAEKESRVVVHGVRGKEEIMLIAARCWGGISSFAMSRNNMTEACTLKVREYLAMGLPVYAGYKEVLPSSFLFYKSGQTKVSEIVSFFASVKHVARKEVAEVSMSIVGKKKLLSDLYASIKNHNA